MCSMDGIGREPNDPMIPSLEKHPLKQRSHGRSVSVSVDICAQKLVTAQNQVRCNHFPTEKQNAIGIEMHNAPIKKSVEQKD